MGPEAVPLRPARATDKLAKSANNSMIPPASRMIATMRGFAMAEASWGSTRQAMYDVRLDLSSGQFVVDEPPISPAPGVGPDQARPTRLPWPGFAADLSQGPAPEPGRPPRMRDRHADGALGRRAANAPLRRRRRTARGGFLGPCAQFRDRALPRQLTVSVPQSFFLWGCSEMWHECPGNTPRICPLSKCPVCRHHCSSAPSAATPGRGLLGKILQKLWLDLIRSGARPSGSVRQARS